MKLGQKLPDLVNEIIARKSIDHGQVKAIRLEIFSEARVIERMLEDGVVDRAEAEMLFSINGALSEGLYDESWCDLFVEAITSHVLKDEMSPGRLDEEEARYILMKIQKGGPVSSIEMDLLANVSASVTSSPPFFHEFVLDALKDYVLRDQVVSEGDTRLIRTIIFGPGSSSGQSIDERERAWLREIDGLTSRGKNHPSWNLLKLEAGLTDPR
jgi:hypothetical protein